MKTKKVMSKKLILLFSLIFLVGMLLSGCGGGQPADKPAEKSDTPATSETAKEDPAGESAEEAAKEAANSNDIEDMGDRLAKVYTDMMQSGKYYMKYRAIFEMEGQKEEAQMEVAVNGEDSAVKSSMSAGESHMVFKDNKSYLIDHNAKTIMVMEAAEIEDKDAGIDTDGLTYKDNGQEDFLGKTLPYEEYSIDDGSIKYFFDGKKLAGMKIVAEEMTQILEVLEISEKYPAEMFTIPADYTRQEINIGS
jgi:hypothetical protein